MFGLPAVVFYAYNRKNKKLKSGGIHAAVSFTTYKKVSKNSKIKILKKLISILTFYIDMVLYSRSKGMELFKA